MSREGILRPDRIRIDRHAVKYLVDANVPSEPTRPASDNRVVAWLRANEREIAVDPIVLGEVRYGILLLRKGKRRDNLERWFEAGARRLHCLAWEAETGLRWAQLVANLRAAGRACRSRTARSPPLHWCAA